MRLSASEPDTQENSFVQQDLRRLSSAVFVRDGVPKRFAAESCEQLATDAQYDEISSNYSDQAVINE